MDSAGRRTLAERVSRLVGSRLGLVAVFCLGLGLLTGAALVLDLRLRDQALTDVREEGELISGLVIEDEFTEADLAAGLPAETQHHVLARVQQLRSRGEVLGLQLWTTSGSLVLSDPQTSESLSADILEEIRLGHDLVEVDERHGDLRSDDVLVRIDLDGDQGADVVAVVLLPRNRLDALRASARTKIGWAGALLALLLATSLALAHRRHARREHAARHDHLTGLGNRFFLADAAQRRGDRAYALLLLDLDGFKEVNDTLGHAAGDELLVQVADVLRHAVRQGDLVIRLGGDEFAILLDRVEEPQQAVHVAIGVLSTLATTGFSVRGIDLDVQASVGVAVNGVGGSGASALLRQADVAMYRAKESRAGVVLYSQDADHHDVDRLAMLGELRRAISDGELVLYYQPLIPVHPSRPARNGLVSSAPLHAQVTSVEALVRWQHRQRGLLAPEEFIPIAEHTGIIHPLTAWVLDEAVAQTACWRRAGLDLTVSVNLSPRAIDASLVSSVLSTLHRHGLPANRLKLEITETAVVADARGTIAILRELHAAGIQISLDDFGAGYTSLSHLTALPLTELKIDRSFVQAVGTNADTSAVVTALIELGHRLGLTVVAEGVETEDTNRELTALGCDSVQGFLYSRPLAAADIEAWLLSRTEDVGTAAHGRPAGARRA